MELVLSLHVASMRSEASGKNPRDELDCLRWARRLVVVLVASRIPTLKALPLGLAGGVSSGVSPVEVPGVTGTTVESSTKVLSAPFVLFVFSA